MKDQFKRQHKNADNNESKVKNLGRLYICLCMHLYSQGKVMLGLNEIESTPKKQDIKTFLVQLHSKCCLSGKNTSSRNRAHGLRVSILNCPKTITIIACPELYYFIPENQMVEASSFGE